MKSFSRVPAMRLIIIRSIGCSLLSLSLIAVSAPESNGQPAGGRGTVSRGSKRFRSVQSFRRTRPARPTGQSGKKGVFASLDGRDKGSLWSDRSPFFFTDKRASRVGDIITVLISESSNSKKEADTSIDRQSNLTFTVPSLPGYGEPTNTNVGSRARRFDPSDALRTTSKVDHSAETDVERTDNLTATISAQVVEVLPNGNLFIEGRKELTTQKETLIVMLSGIIRPQDIAQDNTIQSKFMADAKIVYTGDGILEEAQSPGWLTRVVTKLWPF